MEQPSREKEQLKTLTEKRFSCFDDALQALIQTYQNTCQFSFYCKRDHWQINCKRRGCNFKLWLRRSFKKPQQFYFRQFHKQQNQNHCSKCMEDQEFLRYLQTRGTDTILRLNEELSKSFNGTRVPSSSLIPSLMSQFSINETYNASLQRYITRQKAEHRKGDKPAKRPCPEVGSAPHGPTPPITLPAHPTHQHLIAGPTSAGEQKASILTPAPSTVQGHEAAPAIIRVVASGREEVRVPSFQQVMDTLQNMYTNSTEERRQSITSDLLKVVAQQNQTPIQPPQKILDPPMVPAPDPTVKDDI